MLRFNDPTVLSGTGETPDERWAQAVSVAGTPGQLYGEKRAITVGVAHDAGIRFDPDWNGRPAVLAPMRNRDDALCAVHGRYLHHARTQNKMLTIGHRGGAISVLGGWRSDPLILVEGLFDALSLAVCGYGSVSTVGRWAPWLPEVCTGRVVWLAFDATRPGEADVALYRQRFLHSDVRRLPPPDRCKDWNTALVKRGRVTVGRWLRDHVGGPDAAEGTIPL